MKSLLIVILNLIAFVVMPAAAEAQQSLLQDPVAYEKDHFTKSCDGQVSFGDKFATQQDINNDKLMDIVINEGEITCKGEKQALYLYLTLWYQNCTTGVKQY